MDNFSSEYRDAAKEYQLFLKEHFLTEQSTEHTHRPALITLLKKINSNIMVINEPKSKCYGRVDLTVMDSSAPIGYLETKDLGINLNKSEKTDQLKRYIDALDNFILTNYLEFRWYFKGEIKKTIIIGEIKSGDIIFNNDFDQLMSFLKDFFISRTVSIKTSKDLSIKMANIAKLIKDTVYSILQNKKESNLEEQFYSFKNILMPDLTEEKFSDFYAQTIVYGLFSARCSNITKALTRENATYLLPKTNPFLRKTFGEIAGPDIDDEAVWILDNLINTLNLTDINSIQNEFKKTGKSGDAVLDFYEGFLSQYNPNTRVERGVFYTPKPIVEYIVKSIDLILIKYFQIEKGLADHSIISRKNKDNEDCFHHKVIVLDPATGTGGFLYEVINLIENRFKDNKGFWSDYVSQHLLPRLYGFEILMAPYTISHMKLSQKLLESGYHSTTEQRLNIYLTNTLSQQPHIGFNFHFAQWLIDETNEARQIKNDKPVMVIIGNPPYRAESANKTEWMRDLLKGYDSENNQNTSSYFNIDGEPLKEKNTKWLHDDYVKFIRFAHRKIEMTGYGVIGFVTNHSFIDNPSFAGMRKSLLSEFDLIYILDCHGNVNKKEKSPNDEKDVGLFDIKQGVCICFFIKNNRKTIGELAEVYHFDLWGEREVYVNNILVSGKYHWLSNNDIESTNWKKIHSQYPYYYFIPQETEYDEEYNNFIAIDEIFIKKSVGLCTARDKFCISWSQEEMWKKINDFLSLSEEDARERFRLGNDVRDWKVQFAQQDLKKSGPSESRIIRVSYRPYDFRYTYYTGHSRGFHCNPRGDVMNNLIKGNNYALIVSRMAKGEVFNHSFVSEYIVEGAFLSSSTSTNAYVFPVYIIDDTSNTLFPSYNNIESNFSQKFISVIESKLGLKFNHEKNGDFKSTIGVEDCLGYIYALLNNDRYKQKYNYRLVRDFPRIPITTNLNLFVALSSLGKKLIFLHLNKDKFSGSIKFPIMGSNTINFVKYDNRKIWINDNQYLDNISKEVWGFVIGGYSVCDKWLKSRKMRRLTFEDIEEFDSIVGNIIQTNKLRNQLDILIEKNSSLIFSSKSNVSQNRNKPQTKNLQVSPFMEVLEKRTALAAYIINKLKDDKNLTRTKFAKIYYLVDYMQNSNLKTQYAREVAGPLDARALYNEEIGIEPLCLKKNYFKTQKVEKKKNYVVNYTLGENIDEGVSYAVKILDKTRSAVDNLIELMKPLDYRQAEIVATLFACWNDLIIEINGQPNDEKIITRFYEWHNKKENIKKERVVKALKWMKLNSIIPLGKKTHTVEKFNNNISL
ncbi:type ISP restriction/modification enzyme [Legionella pneumophila serogroup 1]